MRFSGSPLPSEEQGCRAAWAALHLEESWQGRQCRPGPERGGGIRPTLSTLLINLPRGDQRGEARSNTSEEEPRGREDESFGLNEIFQKTFSFFFLSFFLYEPFLPRLLKMICCHEKKAKWILTLQSGRAVCFIRTACVQVSKLILHPSRQKYGECFPLGIASYQLWFIAWGEINLRALKMTCVSQNDVYLLIFLIFAFSCEILASVGFYFIPLMFWYNWDAFPF